MLVKICLRLVWKKQFVSNTVMRYWWKIDFETICILQTYILRTIRAKYLCSVIAFKYLCSVIAFVRLMLVRFQNWYVSVFCAYMVTAGVVRSEMKFMFLFCFIVALVIALVSSAARLGTLWWYIWSLLELYLS